MAGFFCGDLPVTIEFGIGRRMQDFLIVGGGVAGLSAASRLARLGSTTLLERENALGYHTSGRSAAMFDETYGSASTIALSRASRDYLETDDARILSPRGMLLLGTADNAEVFRTDRAGMEMDEIHLDDAQAMVPILDPVRVACAAYSNKARDIDTDLLMQNYARKARGDGAILQTGADVRAIRKSDRGWQVETGNKDYSGRILINAAGAWADIIAGMAGVPALGMQPLRRSMARVTAPDGHDVSSWPMILGTGESWYAKPDAGALLISPADEELTTPHDAWADDLTLVEGIAGYQGCVTAPVTRMISNWAGLRTFAPDRNLVIGFDAGCADFFWLAAQGGYGMQSSPAASKLVADLISGSPPDISPETIAQLSPARFD